MRDDSLKVGAVAKAAGVGVQTLHYYERLGLLPKPQRSIANYRLYSSDAIRRVKFIKKSPGDRVNTRRNKANSRFERVWAHAVRQSRRARRKTFAGNRYASC
jgi:hypothetical protein